MFLGILQLTDFHFQTFGQCYNFIDGGVPAALNHFNIAVVKPYNKNGFVVSILHSSRTFLILNSYLNLIL